MNYSRVSTNWSDNIERVFLDLDGTLYLGDKVLEGAVDFVNSLRRRGLPVHFISNNTSHSRKDGIRKLQRLGFDPQPEEMYSALDSTYDYLDQNGINKIALMANPSLEAEARERGFQLWQDDNSWDVQETLNQPQAVILAFDKTFSWNKLRWGMRLIKRGAQFIATHPDTFCPAVGEYDPDIACLIAAFETADCSDPIVIGKPSSLFLKSLLLKYDQDPRRCVVIGDRLYTDIVLANKLGMRSILTLSGEAKIEDINDINDDFASQLLPQIVISSVSDLICE